MAVTNIFGTQPAGPVPASYLDVDFTECAILASTGNNFASVAPWLETAPYNGYGLNGVRIYGQSAAAGAAIVGASRLSDSIGINDAPTGIVGWGFTDTTSGTSGAGSWGGYFEARKLVGATNSKYTAGVEINVTDLSGGSFNGVNPFDPFQTGQTTALHLASGGSVVGAGKASAALLITNNGAGTDGIFDKGIVFGQKTFGAVGTAAQAMALPRAASIQWYNDTGGQTAQITSNIVTAANTVNLQFLDSGFNLLAADNSTQLVIIPNTGIYTFNAKNATSDTIMQIVGGASSGFGSIEIGGASGATIDLKGPFSDDYDLRLFTTGSGGTITTASGDLQLFAGSKIVDLSDSALQGTEQTAPAAPLANGFRIFAQDNGGGKTQLMVIFASGAAQQIAIQP